MNPNDNTSDKATEHLWTVRDNDGVTHRAIRQWSSSRIYVITACDWWRTHNMSGEHAPVRIFDFVTCIPCTVFDFERPCKP